MFSLDSQEKILNDFFDKFNEIFKLAKNHPNERTTVTIEEGVMIFRTELGTEYKTSMYIFKTC